MRNKTWTEFWDMHSGGGRRTDYDVIYVNTSEAEAIQIFEREFDQNPFEINCRCCGNNFAVTQYILGVPDCGLKWAFNFHRRGGRKRFLFIDGNGKKFEVNYS